METDNVFPSTTRRVKVGCGNLYITMAVEPVAPFQVHFVGMHLGKSGGCARSWASAVGELIAEAWRSGVSIERISEILSGHRCQNEIYNGALSCGDGVATTLVEQYRELVEFIQAPEMEDSDGDVGSGAINEREPEAATA